MSSKGGYLNNAVSKRRANKAQGKQSAGQTKRRANKAQGKQSAGQTKPQKLEPEPYIERRALNSRDRDDI
jgi:hypothetical protein